MWGSDAPTTVLPFEDKTTGTPAQVLASRAGEACDLMKAMAHEGRLVILALLAERERSVTEIEHALSLRQPAVSQQLARLRADDLVAARREGKVIYYSLASDHVREMIATLGRMFDQA